MLFDQQLMTCNEGVVSFPDWVFGKGPRPWPIEEVKIIVGSTSNTTSITGSAGGPDQGN